MLYIKKIISQDIERTPTFNVESIRDFFKINLSNGQHIIKTIVLIPINQQFAVRFQKRETRDGYRVFLNDLFQNIKPSEGDILILRKQSQDVFLCEHINRIHESYQHLNYLFEERNNHQLIIDDVDSNTDNIGKPINFLDDFVEWFIHLDGVKHNYFANAFTKNRDKLKADLIIYEEIYENEFKTKIFTSFTNEIDNLIESLKVNLEKNQGDFFEYSAKKSNHMPRAILGKNNFLKFLSELSGKLSVNHIDFNIDNFQKTSKAAGLILLPHLIQRFIASACAKPFVILTGLSGSGKTKLAQAFSMWISENKVQYAIVPVGADWTNREPLLGYPNSLVANHYVKPDSGVLDILLRAHSDFQANNEELAKCKPYFLILDEMNLSHVERYFADFLSTMESGDSIKLYSGSERYAELDNDQTPITSSLIPRSVKWPKNLFIIGTVNIDETTYMFSPKVLDRANTIEFRIAEDEMKNYFESQSALNMDILLDNVETRRGRGASWAPAFMRLASREGIVIDRKVHQDSFVKFFIELQRAGAEFGYRTANEMAELMAFLAHFNVETNEAYDIAIMQKLLPKLHGSRSKLNKVIPPLLALCENDGKVIYPLSHEKLNRMKKNADENGFASYAEA